VAKPEVGQVMPCGPAFVVFGCAVGEPVEMSFFHGTDAVPAIYHLVRVR
jgi:hypothetical protein